jgi:DNA repair protein RadA/Sms
MPRHAVYSGEIGLGGEVRRVQQLSIRLKEAEKLGFQSAYVAKEKKLPNSPLTLIPLTHIRELVDMIRGHA